MYKKISTLIIAVLFISNISLAQPNYCSWNDRTNHTDQWGNWVTIYGSSVEGAGGVWMRIKRCEYIINPSEDIIGGTTPHGWNIEVRNDYSERVSVKLMLDVTGTNGSNKGNFKLVTSTIYATGGFGTTLNAGEVTQNEGATSFYGLNKWTAVVKFPDRRQ
jgi:hypothetical protein